MDRKNVLQSVVVFIYKKKCLQQSSKHNGIDRVKLGMSWEIECVTETISNHWLKIKVMLLAPKWFRIASGRLHYFDQNWRVKICWFTHVEDRKQSLMARDISMQLKCRQFFKLFWMCLEYFSIPFCFWRQPTMEPDFTRISKNLFAKNSR